MKQKFKISEIVPFEQCLVESIVQQLPNKMTVAIDTSKTSSNRAKLIKIQESLEKKYNIKIKSLVCESLETEGPGYPGQEDRYWDRNDKLESIIANREKYIDANFNSLDSNLEELLYNLDMALSDTEMDDKTIDTAKRLVEALRALFIKSNKNKEFLKNEPLKRAISRHDKQSGSRNGYGTHPIDLNYDEGDLDDMRYELGQFDFNKY